MYGNGFEVRRECVHNLYCTFVHFMQDPCFFTKNIKYITNLDKNKSSLRLLHYPALPDDYNIRPGQIRCGEHVDFGSITLLFPECVDGLQVSAYVCECMCTCMRFLP